MSYPATVFWFVLQVLSGRRPPLEVLGRDDNTSLNTTTVSITLSYKWNYLNSLFA